MFTEFMEKCETMDSDQKPASYFVIKDMRRLNWKPAANETPDKFREWLAELATMYGLTRTDVINASQEWRIYWESRTDKPVKQHKTSLMNSIAFNHKRKNG
jgi:hypothetical protein